MYLTTKHVARSEGLVAKIIYKFCTISSQCWGWNPNKFYFPSTGTTDDGVLSLLLQWVKNIGIVYHLARKYFFMYLCPRAQTVVLYWCRQTYVEAHQKQLHIRDYRLPFLVPVPDFYESLQFFIQRQ